MSFKFWQETLWSIENTAAFMANTCISCNRFWHGELQAEARPVCIIPSYDCQQIREHWESGHDYPYDLPEWFPLGCSYHMDKIPPP